MRRIVAVAGLLVCVAIMTGCIPSFLKPTYSNFAENLALDQDTSFGCDDAKDGLAKPEKTAEEIYQCVNVVHLELVVGLSREAGSAAGFVVKYNNKPHILTAGHVNTTNVKFKAIYAYFSQGHQRPEEVEIVVSDNFLDFALLRFKDPKFVYDGPYAVLGCSSGLSVGQKVYALGSPLGFRYYFSEGIIGKIEQGMDHDGILQPEIIMHGATINPGNSGGPLVDKYGRVVGINVMGISGGFSPFRPSIVTTMPVAIPIDDVKSVVMRTRKGGPVEHSYLGLKLWDTRDLNPLDYEQREVTIPDRDGLIVFLMAKNSPAAKSGLQKGDLILECDGKKYDRTCEIAKRALFETEPGTEMEFKVLRQYTGYQIVETNEKGMAVYKTAYTKMKNPAVLTIKVKPEVR
ncbi:MAG: peptidase S1 and S6, chymotrypsin/Hap [Parcubacteria group bacterium Gr01-1014_3]|nr:MAG: peptidase S1 and S6, chymotrypsin/Hap [Parcubacteria group bacterium Gr01-1014_3]